MTSQTRKALKAYRTICGRLLNGCAVLGAAYAAHADLSAAFRLDPARADYAGFSDFLACNDALPKSELFAELA